MRVAILLVLLCGCQSGDAPPHGVWLSGDLHLHSDHSNDAADNPVDALVAKAESLGMGFFVVTDHDNHVNGMLTTWDDPAYRSNVLTMLYGVEWTTSMGHANIFGAAPFQHAPLYALRDGDGEALAEAAHAQGLHLSINHPTNGDPWEYGFDIGADSIEVWNAMFVAPSPNDDAIALWDGLLMQGRRLTARGGSDCHHQTGIEAMIFNVGNPTTWVRARDRSGAAVLEALAAGHVSIGNAPTSERIELTADANGDGGFETLMGDNVPANGEPLTLRVRIEGFRRGAPYEIRVIKDGVVWRTVEARRAVTTFTDTRESGQRAYYRVEVRGETPELTPAGNALGGGFVGMTNPVYVGFP